MQIEIGKVYVKYRCGHVLHDNGHSVRVADRTNRFPSGNPKKIVVCPICRTMKAGYDYRFKVCPDCNELRWARLGHLRDGRCKVCGGEHYLRVRDRKKAKTETPKITYVQDGREIAPPRHPKTNPHCIYRAECLVSAMHDETTLLHCGGCKRYERIEDGIDLICRREYQDDLYAVGYV
jgi:hypothetical protein